MNIPKKPLTLLLALVMAIGLTAAAFAAEEPRYTDVTEKNWYHDAVVFVTEKKLMDGLTDDTFGPSRNLTRQMLATALYRLAGSPAVEADNPFTDVADGAAYRDAVVWAYSTGVVNGTSETAFSPDSAIERQAIAAMLARYLDADTSGEEGLDGFKDAAAIRSYARGSLSWAVANKLIQGNPDGTVNPRGNATRAQAAAILQRFSALAGSEDNASAGDEDKGGDAPSSMDVALREAEKYTEAGEYEKAAECYRKMLSETYIDESELGEKLFNVAYAANKAEKYDVSVKLLEEAVDKGSAAAANELGGAYLAGRGVDKDEEKALELYQQAEKMGSASAAYNIGVCYAYGYGVKADEPTAFKWFKKAAEAGSPFGMYATGAWYASGTGVKADKEQAVSWLEKYAESGNTVWTEQVQVLLAELTAE
ncbi:MAG: hypothetical protein HFF73_09475 [Oscillospiraceae bacterium]|nr:hypothetical protein [Oscillospiraceae bacterium]